MTPADDPRHPGSGPETVSFGPGQGSVDPATSLTGDSEDTSRHDGPVDAWYQEPDPDAQPEGGPSWLASRWHGWQALDRDRRIVIVLIAVAVLAVAAAVLGLANRNDTTAIELPAVESHGLDPDEAACFSFGLIEKRFDVRLGTDGFDTPDPATLTGPINQEVQDIDDLAADHPEADYRLITAFAAVADAGTTLSDAEGFADFRSAVSKRAAAVTAANEACSEVAGFDVSSLEPS